MRIAAQKINNSGIEVSRTKVRQITEKYVKQLGQSCEHLFDLGYLSSPLFYNEDELMKCLFEEFPEFVPLCRNVTSGCINLSDIQLSYIMKYVGEGHKAYEVLDTAKRAVQASQALSDIGGFVDKVHFKRKDDVLVCRANMAVSSRVYSSGKLFLDSPYMRECFYIKPGCHIEELDYSLEYLKEVLKALGVDDVVSMSDPSLFLGEQFTVADDCEFIQQLIAGNIEGEGKYASLLHETVEHYYSDYYANRTTIAECIKFEEQMFLNSINASIAVVNEFRKAHPDYQEFFVDSKRVYWLAPGVVVPQMYVARDIYIGNDISGLGNTGVALINRLLGYSGQFLYRFDSAVNSYDIVGMPVVMYVLDDKGHRVAVEYYPAVNLRKRFKTMSIPVRNDYTMRTIVSVEDMLEELDISSLEVLADEVADLIDTEYKTHPVEFKSLVGMLVQAVICVMCDYTLQGRKSPNHIHLDATYGWVTDEIYADACAVAETFFGKLGF